MAGYEVTLCDMAPEQLNPVVLMRLVEVVRGLQTSDATVAAARQFARTLGKDTVVCQKDSPGFLLEDLIAAGRLGCTTGHGIYDHDERGAYPPPAPS